MKFADLTSFKILVSCVKTFAILYRANEKFDIISYKEFYNDSVSKYLNLKDECRTYFMKMNEKYKKKDGERPFSLIKYHFLFDAAAKSEIVYIFNYHKQRTEMFNDFMGFNLINTFFLSRKFVEIT